MKISADGGALCIKGNFHFGNYTFTQGLIEAIGKYDTKNEYTVYSFCKKPDWLKIKKKLHYKILKPAAFWLSTRVSIEEMSHRKDIFLALNQAIPFSTKSKIISFSHGLSFYFYPQFYPDSYLVLKDLLEPMTKRSKFIVVPSRRVKTEMSKLFPKYKNFKILNYGIPNDMTVFSPVKRKKFFLFVGMNHRIKNINFIVKVFKEFKENNRRKDYKLFLVGNLQDFEDKENGVFVFSDINREAIRKLYSEAAAYLTASYYESFNFPVLEALAQNCPVIGLEGAVIPEFTKFVSTVENNKDFMQKMVDVSQGRIKMKQRDELFKRFSWKKYVTKLKELY